MADQLHHLNTSGLDATGADLALPPAVTRRAMVAVVGSAVWLFLGIGWFGIVGWRRYDGYSVLATVVLPVGLLMNVLLFIAVWRRSYECAASAAGMFKVVGILQGSLMVIAGCNAVFLLSLGMTGGEQLTMATRVAGAGGVAAAWCGFVSWAMDDWRDRLPVPATKRWPRCFSCGYDMRGSLAAGRTLCPECGEVWNHIEGAPATGVVNADRPGSNIGSE